MKRRVSIGLVLAAAAACLARPAAEAPRWPRAAPLHHDRDRPAPPPEQQHLVSLLLPQLLAELSSQPGYLHGDAGAEALHDHYYYYPDWMDFGRRSAEDSASGS
ncbi:gastrin/cholecystokinin-like peptide [Struthio camelus]|uniref:gastrin/cholecystokinin-like peptide n=1 Tax=Struthio camelus TaxID=8801 RepID=UPI0036042F75